MPRIAPVTLNDTPQRSRPLLDAVEKKLGRIPNMLATLARSPAALSFYLAQTQALAGGTLAPQLREQIALTTAGFSGCAYCACAHAMAAKVSGIDPTELAGNLAGRSAHQQVQVALDFVNHILTSAGHVDDDALLALRQAGYDDGAIVEIIAHVGMNLFTNYFNHIVAPVIDFPPVSAH